MVRLAPEAPDVVRKILEDMPDTDNYRIRLDVLEAALLIDAEGTKALAGKVQTWVPALLIPQKVAELVAKLLTDGETASAVSLAAKTLALEVVEDRFVNDISLGARAVSGMAEWDYQSTLHQVSDAFRVHAPRDGLRMVADILGGTLGALYKGRTERQGHTDPSHIWRSTLGPPGNWDELDKPEWALVSAVRDLAHESAARGEDGGCPVVRRN